MMSKWIFCLLSCLAVSTIVESWDLVSIVKRSYCKRNILSAFCAPPAPATDPPPPPPPSPASSGSESSAYCDTNSIFAIFCTPTTPAPPPPPPPPSALPSYCSDPVFCVLCNTCVTTTETPTTTEAETTTAAETTEVPTTTEAATTTTEAATTTTEELTTTTEAVTTTTEELTTTTEALTEEPTTTTEEPTTTEALTTTTEEPTTTTEEPTTTTEEPTTTTEALTTTEAPTTTTIPEKLCPDPSVNVRYRRVVDGTPSASCDIPGAVRLFHPVFGVVLCTGVLLDASTVQVPKSCGDVATLPHIIGELELTVGDGADEQKAKASSAADGSVPGTTEITLDTPFDVTVCPGLPCMYDSATMEGYIDFTKCSAGGYGTTQEAAVGETPQYSGLQGFTIDSIDETSCAIPAGTTPYSCAVTSTGSPCTGDGGGPVTCEAVTGEQVVIGQVEDFPCDSTKPFSFIDFTKA